jgi:hypothetical protein
VNVSKRHVVIVMAYLTFAVGILAIASATCGSPRADGGASSPPAPEGRFAELWKRAEGGDEDDLGRLANAEGAGGLEERLRADPARRLVAIRAAGYGSDFQLLGDLAEFAKGDKEDVAAEALKSAHRMLREHRGALGEDAQEFGHACEVFLTLAKEGRSERKRAANGLLRMMVPLGCSSDSELDGLVKSTP